jgi:hypothetical protein
MDSGPDDEVDSETLLAQGDALLESSRRLLDLLEDRIQGDGAEGDPSR